MGNKLIKSIYTIVFVSDNKFYLYNSRANFFSEISKDLYEAIDNCQLDSLPQYVVDKLLSKEIILSKGTEYDYYYSELLKFNIRNYSSNILNLVIAPTTSCNFDCPYCFEPKNNPKTITDDVIQDLLQFIKSHNYARELNITWYGGEPLLAFEKIKSIYELITQENLPPITTQSIITNGYCFNNEVIDFFKSRNLNSVQITIDGVKERHNETRFLRVSKSPTFDRILQNIEKISINLPNTRVDIRVNINKSNYLDFVEIYKYIQRKFPNNKAINAYPGIIREDSTDKTSLCANSFKPSELVDLYRLIESKGVKTYIFPQVKNKGCMMHSLNSYIIGPEGEIYKCWNDVSNPNKVIGNISSNKLLRNSLLTKYSIQSIPFNEECKNCAIFPICDGGCSLYRYRNLFKGCKYEICSPYKDIENLKTALLSKEIHTH